MNEALTIWIVAAALVAVVFVPYVIRFRRSRQRAADRKQEAKALGIDRATGQYPMIDRSACIGCGSCVDACPEGDVLAVVWGAADVVNGQRCVGHGFCEPACPVGALKVGLGDVKTRPDIPILTEHNETSVPGVFIAGELSGLSLIRHAVAQGRRVADEIASRSRGIPSRPGTLHDMVVVGAGPAGLSAALMARAHGLDCVVLDQYDLGGTILHYPRQKLVMTQPVEIPLYGTLDHDEYSKEELLAIWQSVCRQNQIAVRSGEKVAALGLFDEGFRLSTTSGTIVDSRFVVLALGRRGSPRKLGVPGEELPKVMYQLIDAQSYQNQHVLVVGGGDSAVEAAIGLARQPGNTVGISYRKSRFFRIKKRNEERVERLIESGAIRPYFDSEVRRIEADAVILQTPDGEVSLRNDHVIIQAGGVPPYEMLKSFGVTFGGAAKSIEERDRRLELLPV